MKVFRKITIGVSSALWALWSAVALAQAPATPMPMSRSTTTIDHFGSYNRTSHTSSIDGLAQMFRAPERYLVDASLLLSSDDGRGWWQGGHFEVRSGIPDSVSGAGGNVLFKSSLINFSALPQRGVAFDGTPLYELRLSNLGLNDPLELRVGQFYSLVVVDAGTSGWFHWPSNHPNMYSSGLGLVHERTAAAVSWVAGDYNLAFRLISSPVPEPASATIVLLFLSQVMMHRRRRI